MSTTRWTASSSGTSRSILLRNARKSCGCGGADVADHGARGEVQRGEQVHGAVAGVVVGGPLRAGGQQRQGRGGPVDRLDLGFSSTANTAAASGGLRYSPTMSRTLSIRCGSGEILKLSWRQGLSPNARQISATVVLEIPCLAASPRVDQCVSAPGVAPACRPRPPPPPHHRPSAQHPAAARRPAPPAGLRQTGAATCPPSQDGSPPGRRPRRWSAPPRSPARSGSATPAPATSGAAAPTCAASRAPRRSTRSAP